MLKLNSISAINNDIVEQQLSAVTLRPAFKKLIYERVLEFLTATSNNTG
jgi:hypothetical protein